MNSENPTVKEEICMLIFSPFTIQRAREMMKSGESDFLFEKFEMNFRLLNVQNSVVNFEFLTANTLDVYYTPVGFIYPNGSLCIVEEFLSDYRSLVTKGFLNPSPRPLLLDLESNALIAAFSMETFKRALEYKDIKLTANGLKCELFICSKGYPQMFLDDSYNRPGPIAAYLLREQPPKINPMLDNEEAFKNLFADQLLQVYKRVAKS